MKQLIKAMASSLGYEIRRKMPDGNQFTVRDIKYEVDPCSVGWEPQGEGTAEGAIRMIRERELRDLKILDICCGVGVIGLTIFTRLRNEAAVTEIGLSDINIFNINSLNRTLKANQLDGLVPTRIRYWLSDGLNHITRGEKFDIIVSNPPHFFSKDHTEHRLLPKRLAMYDADWSFHRSFYERSNEFLTDRGEVWFLENGEGASETDFLPFIQANPNLRYVQQCPEPLLPGFFWMITQKSG